MKYIAFCITLLFITQLHAISNGSDSLFKLLDKHIDKRTEYTLAKKSAIDKLVHSIPTAQNNNNLILLYFLYSELANEYDAYNYDSAMVYAKKRIDLAYQINDKSKIAFSKSETANILIKRGLYREGIDSLLSVTSNDLAIDMRVKHFGHMARAYYDIADYNKDSIFSPAYRMVAEHYVDSVLITNTEKNYYTSWFEGLRYLARYDLDKAVVIYEDALLNLNTNSVQKAQLHSALGYIYREYDQQDKSLSHTINAAIYDLITSTKESMALTSLAGFLYVHGDIKRAHKYVLVAKEDADFFGAKLRQLSISHLLPKIEAAQHDIMEKKRKAMFQSVIVIGSVLLIISSLALLSFVQLKRLRNARKQILITNSELVELTDKLREANKIKTEYIGYYFNFSTQYIDKLEGLKKVINTFITNKNFDGIDRAIKSLDTKSERERLFKNFDNYFLIIFPEFIDKFNQLLKPEAKITTEDKELSTDLRIFALIRLGIKDNESIAKILGFSVNTIYTYKTKVKKLSIVSSTEFDQKIMEIRSV